MAYIKSKNCNTILFTEMGQPVAGAKSELESHAAVLSGHYEVIDAEVPENVTERIVYISNEE